MLKRPRATTSRYGKPPTVHSDPAPVKLTPRAGDIGILTNPSLPMGKVGRSKTDQPKTQAQLID